MCIRDSDQLRLQLFARFFPITYVGLEAGAGVSAAWARGSGFAVNQEDLAYYAGVALGLVGRIPLTELIDVWLSARGWVWVNSTEYEIDGVGVFRFPTFAGDFQAGVSLRF